jgi:hypothetical protein
MFTSVQIIISGVLLVMLILLADLFPFWMPTMNQMVPLTFATVLLVTWAGFVMFEATGDERELLHRMHAGRAAYLAGLAVLTLALVVQGLSHTIDPWILGALGAMVVSKIVARAYFNKFE